MQIEFEEMLKFSKELYSRTALIKAAYNFTDMAYIHLDADDHYYYVFISAKEDGKSISEKDFINEMLSQSVRHVVYKQTKNIREIRNDCLILHWFLSKLIYSNDIELFYSHFLGYGI